MDKTVFDKIDEFIKNKSRVLIAIDGPCAGGKSTFAEMLGQKYDCNIFHMDDFFLPSIKRTDERLKEAGGNIDYERFEDEIVRNLLCDCNFSYGKYSCREEKIIETVQISVKKLNIIEGVYSLHPNFSDIYDLKIFINTDKEEQLKRLKTRAPEKLEKFITEWIPKENAYFDKFKIKSVCDFVIDNKF